MILALNLPSVWSNRCLLRQLKMKASYRQMRNEKVKDKMRNQLRRYKYDIQRNGNWNIEKLSSKYDPNSQSPFISR